MSLKDQKAFLSKIHPFEVLSHEQMEICIKNMDIAYYPKDSILISAEKIPNHFFIIIKGSVYEYSIDNEVVIDYQEEDSFDSNSLIYAKATNTFKVYEDLICYELEKNIFLKLIEQNQQFRDYFLKDLVNKIQTLKDKKYTSELSSYMISKVEDTLIHEPCIIDEDTTLINAIQKSMEYKTSSIIVKRKNKEYGIITDSILKTRVLLEGRDLNIPVKDIAKFPLLTVFNDDYLFEALTILVKKNIKRIGVLNHNNEMIGILEQIDILSHFSNHTYMVDSKIKKAKNIDDLKDASENLLNIIKNLNTKGVKVNHISNLIGQLNTKVYQKLYDLIVPFELQQKACFIVMGSEGRNEQIIKTDQDNALIVKDNIDVEQFRPYMDEMIECLTNFGYPLCDGNIMASNPFWCKTVSEYKNEITKWIEKPNMQNYIDLAIFFDSFAVAGDKELLINLKDGLFNNLSNRDVFMAYFAKTTLTFDTPNIISNFITKKSNIDIKKTAIFPIVQGIRTLALREKIKETTTLRRIKILEDKKILEKNRAAELTEAFDFVNTLRLKYQLQTIQSGKKINNEIDTHTLGKVERDLLKDSFKIVNEFKKFISYTFKIDKIS
jgi:CBS domain-containing protein